MNSSRSITVNPPIWFRWWAFLIYGLILYLLIKSLLTRQRKAIQKRMLLDEAVAIKEKNIIIEQKNQQNELLLKEIHHRVKNNLQTISSLLFLQSASLEDDDAKASLKAVQQRVESMALIHKKLYEENDLSKIEMKGYVKLLVDNLVDSFGYGSEHLKTKFQVTDVKLEMDQAIPVGLLITELVTNSLKYAYPDRINGKLSIKLEEENNFLQLTVKDNGPGKNENHKESFGSKLIRLLNRQLEGEMTSGNDNGHWTTLKFKKAS